MTHTSRHAGLIRMALMGAAFIALTIVLIVFQPGSPRHAQTSFEPDTSTTVTRADPLAQPAVITPPVTVAPVVQAPAPVAQPQIATSVPSPAQSAGQPTNMRDMTFSAISNLKSVTTGEAPAPGQPGSLLHSVVQRSIANGTPAPAATRPVTRIEPVSTGTPRAPSSRSYFVRPGDTLLSIAIELYGDTSMSSEIFRQNANIMSSPDSLKPGMVLNLPAQ